MDEILLISILGITVGFFIQTVFGFAAALAAVPILLIHFTLQEAMAIMAPFYLIFSLILIYPNWQKIDKKEVGILAVSMVPGFLLGAYLLHYGNPLLLKKLFGIFIILYLLYFHLKKNPLKNLPYSGPLFGFLGGILSGLFASGGAMYVIYLYSKIDQTKIIRASIIGLFAITNLLRIGVFIENGLLTRDVLEKALPILPFFLIALYLGEVVVKKIDQERFKKWLTGMLIIAAFMLIIK